MSYYENAESVVNNPYLGYMTILYLLMLKFCEI